MATDDGWDFNCPQYVDFSRTGSLKQDDAADRWFDYDHENGVPVVSSDMNKEPETFSTPESDSKYVSRTSKSAKVPASSSKVQSDDDVCATATPELEVKRVTRSQTPLTAKSEHAASTVDTATPEQEVKRVTRSQTPKMKQEDNNKPGVLKNICTNIQDWRKRTAGQGVSHASIKKEPERKEMKPTENNAQRRQHRSLERSESMQKKQRPNVPQRGKGQSNLQRSSSFSTLRMKSGDRAGTTDYRQIGEPQRTLRSKAGCTSESNLLEKVEKSAPTKTHMTIPTTPTLMKRKPMKDSANVKNSEALELEKIEFYRQELAKKRKMAQDSYKTALSAKGPAVVVNNKEPTKTQAFQFETDNRVKTHTMETRQDCDVKDFSKMLRSEKSKSPAGSKRQVNTCTVPQPFKLTEVKKRRLGDLDEKQAEKYESMAQKLAAFQATPERFRSKKKEEPTQKRGKSPGPCGITVPKTPNFETRTRSRPVTAPSREELEDKEVEEMKKNQFKARPMNQKIFTQDKVGVKEVPRKPPTVVEGFHLSTDKRSHERAPHNTSEETYEFHAQPLNKKILEGVTGLQPVKPAPVTIPESPALALKHRARIPVEVQPQEEQRSRRSRPVPHFGIPFQPQLEHKITEPEPFTFEERDKMRIKNKEQKIEQILEEEQKAREFHANPLPDLDNSNLPFKKKMPATVVEPFNLESDNRGAKRAEEWKHKMEEELRQQKEMKKFRARSPTVLEQEPFQPQKVNKYTTDISAFELSTAKRATEREEFEHRKKMKQDEADSIRRQEQKIKEEEERLELERLRQEATHKAQPIKKYKPVIVRSSDKPLTAPHTPNFKTNTRLNRRSQQAADGSVIV